MSKVKKKVSTRATLTLKELDEVHILNNLSARAALTLKELNEVHILNKV